VLVVHAALALGGPDEEDLVRVRGRVRVRVRV